jgi:hypothetical protein
MDQCTSTKGHAMTDADGDVATTATSHEVVTLCGSMRFFPQMLHAAADLTAQGCIVLAPFKVVSPKDQDGDLKGVLDRLHLAKIDMAVRVVVITDQTGYIGESTHREMAYATSAGKPVHIRTFTVPSTADLPPR